MTWFRHNQVVGMVFAEEELELVTGGADGTFLVWQMPTLSLKQRFTRLSTSPLVSVNRFVLAIKIFSKTVVSVAARGPPATRRC